jgi:Uri superfamily endonuclease
MEKQIIELECLEKEIIRKFTSKTRFISLFGVVDEVNEKEEYYIKDGCGFVLGENKFRMIYDGSWANII